MKRIVAFLIDVMCVFSLTACVKMKNVDYDSFVKSTENTSSEYLQIDSEGVPTKNHPIQIRYITAALFQQAVIIQHA